MGSADGATAFYRSGAGTPIPVGDAYANASAEHPVLVPGLFRTTGALDVVLDLMVAAAGELAGPAAAERLRTDGVERLHDVCTQAQLQVLIDRVEARLKPLAFSLQHALVSPTASGLGNRYFARAGLSIRALMPLQQFPEGFDAGRFLGRVYPHAPHRDAEYTAPVRSVSYWAAVGPVRADNSMAISPASDAEHEPIVPVCGAGDVVVFADRTLHATIPNFTDETRVVVSFRTAPGRFLRFGAGTNFHPYVDARLMGTPFVAGVEAPVVLHRRGRPELVVPAPPPTRTRAADRERRPRLPAPSDRVTESW